MHQWGIKIKWGPESTHPALENIAQHGYSPDNWEVVRKGVRACEIPTVAHRQAWRNYHPNGKSTSKETQ